MIVKGGFGPAESGVNRRRAMYEVIRNPVLRVRRAGRTPELLGVGFVFAEQRLRRVSLWPRTGDQYPRADAPRNLRPGIARCPGASRLMAWYR